MKMFMVELTQQFQPITGRMWTVTMSVIGFAEVVRRIETMNYEQFSLKIFQLRLTGQFKTVHNFLFSHYFVLLSVILLEVIVLLKVLHLQPSFLQFLISSLH